MTPEETALEAGRLIEANSFDEAWRVLAPVSSRAVSSEKVAWALLSLLEKHPSPPEVGTTLREMLESHKDEWLVYYTSVRLLAPIDGRHTDDEIDDDDPSLLVISAMQRAIATISADGTRDDELGHFWCLLGSAYRYAGPEYDEEAERAYRAALAVDDRPAWRFDLGLLYKGRGRWDEGVELYQRLLDAGTENESVLWNLGICATGAGRGKVACDAWTRAGFVVTLGEDGLPRMENLGKVKVRLSTGTLKEKSVRDYEHVWVQPVSPCHGEILNPTMYDHGYEIGDLVLWDGQPIGRWRQGDQEGSRFAALGKLAEGQWRTFEFEGRQSSAGQIQRVSDRLPNESCVYSFEEQVAHVCTECIRTGGPHTAAHQLDRRGLTLVRGKLVLCPRTQMPDFIAALEKGIASEPGVVIACPELYMAVGNMREASRQQKLIDDLAMLA